MTRKDFRPQDARPARLGWDSRKNARPHNLGVWKPLPQVPHSEDSQMKYRILIALSLAAILIMPVVAQQNSSYPSNQPAAQTDQPMQAAPAAAPKDLSATSQSNPQGSKDSPTMATGKEPLTYESHQGFWGKINPFARKKYVQRQLQPVRDRMNELDELTAANTKQISDVDARAQQGIQMASAKANEADTHAIDAGNRATAANQTAQQASTRLGTVEHVVGNIDQYQPTSQVEIRVAPGQVTLSKKAKSALDDVATTLKDQKGYVVEVQGFSSGRGTAAVRNSQGMAEAVVRYLVLNHDVPVYRIYTLGMGNAPLPVAADGSKARRTNGGRV
jgi:outer membrane protein OmpA-like peptidoglycan-associated protein